MRPAWLAPRVRPLSQEATEVSQLLERYPELAGAELERLRAAFPRLALIDQGLLMADASLGRRLEVFLRDHRRRIDWLAAGQRLAAPLAAVAAFSVLAAVGVW